MILGPSGSGKSTLALAMMGLGAQLVSDDQTEIMRDDDRLVADAPYALRGMIEARGVGLLQAESYGPVVLSLVADLGLSEVQRLPPKREHRILGLGLPLVLGPITGHLHFALRQYLLAGRKD